MNDALRQYFSQLDQGLAGLSRKRRRSLLRELEAHFRDEIEVRRIGTATEMAAFLMEKEDPQHLARLLVEQEDDASRYQWGAALLAGALLGLATGGWLWLQSGWLGRMGFAFGVIHGLVVGTGIFLIRPHWQRARPKSRLLLAILLGSVMAIPLGFTSLNGFVLTRIFYGSFTGYLLERHSQTRPVWQFFVEVAAFTVFDACMEVLIVQRMVSYDWFFEASFNLFLAFAVVMVLYLNRIFSRHWLFRPHPKS